MRKNFISFEGVDGAGKSSHIPWLAQQLRLLGHTVVETREPGGTPLGEKLRGLLLNDEMHIDTELLLMFASRKEHLHRVIEPALAAGHIVLCDRFHDSSYAFQGGGRLIPEERLQALDQWCGGVRPDVTLLFDVPTEVAQARLMGNRESRDRFEVEAVDFHRRVREAYLDRAEAEPFRFKVVDSTRTMEDIRAELSAWVLKNYS